MTWITPDPGNHSESISSSCLQSCLTAASLFLCSLTSKHYFNCTSASDVITSVPSPPNQTFLSSHWDPFPGSTSPHQLAPALLVLQPQTPALLQNRLSGRKSRLRLALKQVLTALQPSICSSQHPGSESASFSPCVCSANRTLTGVHCLCVCFCSTTAWKLLFSGLRLAGGWELLNQVDPAVYFFLVGEKNMSS